MTMAERIDARMRRGVITAWRSCQLEEIEAEWDRLCRDAGLVLCDFCGVPLTGECADVGLCGDCGH